MSQLRYVLVVPNEIREDQVTIFQGWNPVVRNPEFLSLLFLLASLPASPDEIFLDQTELIRFRTAGAQRTVVSVGASLLSDLDFGNSDEIVVYLALNENLASVKQFQLRTEKKYILLSPSDDPAAIDIRKRKKVAHQYIDEEILSLLSENYISSRKIRGPYNTSVHFPKNHGINVPNMAVLKGLGFTIAEKERQVNQSFEEAEQLVIDSANIVLQSLRSPETREPQTLLYCPSVKAHFYDFKHIAWNQIFRDVPEKWKRKIIEALFRNTGYSEFLFKTETAPTNPYSDKILGPILSERQSELYATTASISLMASNETMVSIRLPNGVNLQGGRLRNIETIAKRSDAKAFTLLQREFSKFTSDLRSSIGENIIALIRSGGNTCTLCSDVPLEWLYLEDLPLMISHEVSRIPMTPGNTQLQYASVGERIAFPEASFKKILVVRSFQIGDPLLQVFEHCLDQFDLKERLEISIVDVATTNEAKAALNAFDGQIVVFDCHGDHGGNKSFGWLQFGNEQVNTWELAYEARIPAVVLLSACSTSPIGGSHVSVSAGLLRSGAHSVLGTFLPVNGPRSALFIARILARLDTFLPALRKAGYKLITWRAFVHTVMQMSYLTDVLVYLKYDLHIVDDATFLEIEMRAMRDVSTGDPAWFSNALETISGASKLSKQDIVRKILSDHPLMETMRYCQVGRPDRIGIHLDDDLP